MFSIGERGWRARSKGLLKRPNWPKLNLLFFKIISYFGFEIFYQCKHECGSNFEILLFQKNKPNTTRVIINTKLGSQIETNFKRNNFTSSFFAFLANFCFIFLLCNQMNYFTIHPIFPSFIPIFSCSYLIPTTTTSFLLFISFWEGGLVLGFQVKMWISFNLWKCLFQPSITYTFCPHNLNILISCIFKA